MLTICYGIGRSFLFSHFLTFYNQNLISICSEIMLLHSANPARQTLSSAIP